MNDEFYIGWEDKAPPGVGSRARLAVVVLIALTVTLAVGFPLAQRTIGVSVFEWGKVKEFSGLLRAQPYPHLLVPRPGTPLGQTSYSSYHLVKPFKFGFDPAIAAPFDGKSVNLKGTLIYRGNQTMVEVEENSIRLSQPAPPSSVPGAFSHPTERADGVKGPPIDPTNLGQQTLVGEIVDSKCYLGVMNPGALIPHRACAIRCISGGIPPVLLVRQSNGPALCFLLVARDGKPVNKQVLGMVAEPVEITGEVERQGELLVLRADPATYRRVTK